ncbi:MAG: DUF1731 domain-containing protein, partial [Pseudomonadota bacterium]|nr:DUF1731 domain-containing protein [Pseudomonadota bacterium]
EVFAGGQEPPTPWTLCTVTPVAMGEMSRLLLSGQKAVPDRLTGAGFGFLHGRVIGEFFNGKI